MNEIILNILNRRSVRCYSDKPIEQDDLDLVLKAGLYAPSGCNTQPWHFTVVQNKEIMRILNIEAKKEFEQSENEMFKRMANDKNFNIFYDAPMIIVISGEKSAISAPVDCTAATENMCLAAESLSIATCWIGLVAFLFKSNRAQKYIEMLEIPEGYEPYYAITLGYKMFPNPYAPPRRENTVNYIM